MHRHLLLILLLLPAVASSQEDPQAEEAPPEGESDHESGESDDDIDFGDPGDTDFGDAVEDEAAAPDAADEAAAPDAAEDAAEEAAAPDATDETADPDATDETGEAGEPEVVGQILDEEGHLVLPAPQNIGGLAILPLSQDTDVVDLIRHLHVDPNEAILLVTGAPEDRYSVNGIRLQLPPPFLIFQLDTGVSVVAVVRGTEVHEERVPTAEGQLSHFDTDSALAGRKTDAEVDLDQQRALLADLYSSLDDTSDVVEKIRICIRFIDVYPEGSATEKARAILTDLRAKIADEDESSLDLSDEAQSEMEKLRRQEAFGMAPRPPGTGARKVGGFTFLGGTVALGVAAVALDQTANGAAATYHQLVLESTEAAAAPYLDQARRNDRAFQASLIGAITCGSLSVVLLVSDALVHQRWLKIRDRLEIGDEEPRDEPEAALIPAPFDGGFGVALGGVF